MSETVLGTKIDNLSSLIESQRDDIATVIDNQTQISESQKQIIEELTEEPEDSQQLANTLRRIANRLDSLEKLVMTALQRKE